MKTNNVLVCLSILIFIPLFSFAQENHKAAASSTELDSYFAKVIKENDFVGLGACFIKDNKIIWQNSFGYAELEQKKPVAVTDIFQIASLSKVVTATALMQLYEKGLFNLDDDINNYIPIKVRNPNFPDNPITFRMLLTHTEAFDDLLPMGNKIVLGVAGDHPIPLTEYVEELFTPGGKYYSADYFAKHEPGSRYAYSNIGFSLIGYLVEKISGQDFEEYCRDNIFIPLEMNNTSWHLKGLDTSRVVYGYGFRGNETDVFKKSNHFGTPGYPEGNLRTTMQDFANLILAFLNNGEFKGYSLLKPGTVDLMLTPQVMNIPSRTNKAVDMALTWVYLKEQDCYSMNGFSGSIFTNAVFSMKEKTGIIYFFTGIRMRTMPVSTQITDFMLSYLKNL
jgi:CubicO group peptidase (beta-lactamase class C family)